MKKGKGTTFSLVILTMLLLPALALADYQLSQYYPLGIRPVDKMTSNGEYDIHVLSEGTWQEAGELTYDKFFRERELDLSSYISGNGKVKVKLIQTGGGAANIDSVFLGGTPPVEVEGIENGLKKITKKDFDVTDAFGKKIVVTFPEKTKDKTLSLTARVESTEVSKTPFQFPSENLYKEMDVNSKFYTYNLSSENNSKVSFAETFFKEFSIAGSGHPSGYTYGWVSNDDKNLYVKIDLTGDNTMDGGKDYAKVYAKTESGLKEFKVSMAEKIWGKPAYTYTDKVPYQHKVYEFQIPLMEFGINEVKKGEELLLAFSAYGTIVPVVNCPTPNPLELTCNGKLANCVGTPGGDDIFGTPRNDVIVALGGNDYIYGYGGRDTICAGDGNDYVTGGPGRDWIDGEKGNDCLKGNTGRDVMHGGKGNDELFGEEHDDEMHGGQGCDRVDGGPGDDYYLSGGQGDDSVIGCRFSASNCDAGATECSPLHGGVWGCEGNDTLEGGQGDDWLSGGPGDDTLEGGQDDDTLLGESGDDYLYGGPGSDCLCCDDDPVCNGGPNNPNNKGKWKNDVDILDCSCAM